ncbi:hypothetical protein GCM10018787_36500 [Streptomyces thermodiastaticus]|nr:hypothetical protein GCM10018787_36500 [Streptomyces thermodiastaticus]
MLYGQACSSGSVRSPVSAPGHGDFRGTNHVDPALDGADDAVVLFGRSPLICVVRHTRTGQSRRVIRGGTLPSARRGRKPGGT